MSNVLQHQLLVADINISKLKEENKKLHIREKRMSLNLPSKKWDFPEKALLQAVDKSCGWKNNQQDTN